MVRAILRSAPALLVFQLSACAMPDADRAGTGTSLTGSSQLPIASHNVPVDMSAGLFEGRFDHTRLDATEQVLRRSRLISFDFVQTMIQLDELHPQRVRIAVAHSDSRFDEILLYSLTLAGYDVHTDASATPLYHHEGDSASGRLEFSGSIPPEAVVQSGQDGIFLSDIDYDRSNELPQVIDPQLDHYPIGSRQTDDESGTGVAPSDAILPVVLTTRVVAEPPLLPGGESRAGVYSFIVSATFDSAPRIQLKRIYRVSGAKVTPVSSMQVRGVDARDLQADDSVF